MSDRHHEGAPKDYDRDGDFLTRMAIAHLELAISHLMTVVTREEVIDVLRQEANSLEEFG